MAQLNVSKREEGRNSVTYTYGLHSSDIVSTGPLVQEYEVTPNCWLIRGLCKKIDDVVCRAQKGSDTGNELARVGKLLYDALLPGRYVSSSDFAYLLHGEDSLLVCSNEFEIPWELLHNGDDFLALRHDLGRKTFVAQKVASGRAMGPLKRALVVRGLPGDVGVARQEAGNIAAWLRDHGAECTSLVGADAALIDVVQSLDEGDYDLFHYSGHIDTPFDSKVAGLRLNNDELLDERALRLLSSKGVPPIVFISGCASSCQLENLCVSFMITGAKVVIGTRYVTPEESVYRFATIFYAAMLDGETAGASVRAARHSLARTDSIDWASFVLYGDPSTVITAPQPGESEGFGGSCEAAGDMTRTVEPVRDIHASLPRTEPISTEVLGWEPGFAALLALKDLLSETLDGMPVEGESIKPWYKPPDAGGLTGIEQICQTHRNDNREGQVPSGIAMIARLAAVLRQVIFVLWRWLAVVRTPRRSAEISIDGNRLKATGLSRENVDRLITAFTEESRRKS